MRVLVITRSPWDDTNSTGNTMSNLWSGYDSQSIANIYCRVSKPNNLTCRKYYSISEEDLLKSIFNRKYLAGKKFKWSNDFDTGVIEDKEILSEKRLYDYFRGKSSLLAHWIQELIWKFGNWKNEKLDEFLLEFKPDIIFFPCFAPMYTHRLLWYIQKKTNAKVVLFHADDYLTLYGQNGRSLGAINKKIRSRIVANSSKKADINYCISPKQQKEYSHLLNRPMKLLFKGKEFSEQPINKIPDEKVIRIVYVGSTQYGRWRTLGMLSKEIQKINVNAKKVQFELLIYSQYKPSKKEEKAMILDGASRFMGKIPADQVPQVLREADIVLHIESFERKERLSTRLSFSTKIVDCLHSGRSILAIGWKEAASIDYLIKNDAALVATDEQSLGKLLTQIQKNPTILSEYAQKAWKCGEKNHQISKIQQSLYEDLSMIHNETHISILPKKMLREN